MISVTAIVRLGRDAEVKQVGGGQVLEFNAASSEKNKAGEVTTWMRCSMFGERGAKLAQYLTKGKQVAIRGTLKNREYTGKDGSKKTSLEVKVDDLEFVGSKNDGAGSSQTRGYQQTDIGGDDSFNPDDF